MSPNTNQLTGSASGPVVYKGDFSIANALAAGFQNLENGYLPHADVIFRQILSFQPDNL